MLPLLVSLLKDRITPRSLARILDVVFQRSGLRQAAEQALRGRLHGQAARTAAAALGRALVKLIDAAVETAPEGATVAQRAQVGALLAQNAALQLAEAAELLLAYPELEVAVVRARESGDPAALTAARQARAAGVTRVKQAFVDVARAATGDPPANV